MTMKSYYGQSTLYRLIRPLAIAELIEQQITYAYFSVDMTAVELLRFKRAASLALSDADPILKHPDARWIGQSQHLFSGTINKLANALIIPDDMRATSSGRCTPTSSKTFFSTRNSKNDLRLLPISQGTFTSPQSPFSGRGWSASDTSVMNTWFEQEVPLLFTKITYCCGNGLEAPRLRSAQRGNLTVMAMRFLIWHGRYSTHVRPCR